MIKWTICDLLAPPDVIKKYVRKNNEPGGCPYNFDLNKIDKVQEYKKRVTQEINNYKHWGTTHNVSESGYVPGSDSVSFWCRKHCPDIAIKKIFSDNPNVPIRFYWFNEGDDREHYYIRGIDGKIRVKHGEGALR